MVTEVKTLNRIATMTVIYQDGSQAIVADIQSVTLDGGYILVKLHSGETRCLVAGAVREFELE